MSEFEHKGFEQAIDKYVMSLETFAALHDLPQEWFANPDHLAIKCLDYEHYEQTVEAWLPGAREASYITMDGRKLASIHLGNEISLGSFGAVEWLEILEPRPAKVGTDTVGIDHMEFFYPDFASAELALRIDGVSYDHQSNPSHQWLNIVINTAGQELKLNNRPLADIVAQELEDGNATLL